MDEFYESYIQIGKIKILTKTIKVSFIIIAIFCIIMFFALRSFVFCQTSSIKIINQSNTELNAISLEFFTNRKTVIKKYKKIGINEYVVFYPYLSKNKNNSDKSNFLIKYKLDTEWYSNSDDYFSVKNSNNDDISQNTYISNKGFVIITIYNKYFKIEHTTRINKAYRDLENF